MFNTLIETSGEHRRELIALRTGVQQAGEVEFWDRIGHFGVAVTPLCHGPEAASDG
ncbi:hypothetical protein [Streptomyces alanosinicus]|uniref:Uncharacterized protein n=1 Tax=Streptomyces alanosinicus TaxID=68171 RepID=A0A918YH73_9ACTN|nr:hypothetical protein [Streptomyces alanosinicus]GHE03917.1 hypothetical protein GCM10010339_33320 [Streptomyces alanosinicus]